ncbi:hypothetical protein BABINDRAFT_159164 [Babjeviella inositovora NRRL Y-12698]|uniref:Uncharacterized protein n=1 Tax=Babjeviella inositovora NRRL Y-12698 TaxID=984486 RepID=A0A1E3QZW3_9ASCO|nr:uncharacterized protein BABINDRAFT_159164 [Babjeviella inositovora NRRL Y-12698]ODQ82612.1 hypothetical protein BABINDRAFT_159164 [Babjeviella inositovora NRRL Y-12698]
MNLKQTAILSVLATSRSVQKSNSACALLPACSAVYTAVSFSSYLGDIDVSSAISMSMSHLCGLSDEEFWNDAWTCHLCTDPNDDSGSSQAKYKANVCKNYVASSVSSASSNSSVSSAVSVASSASSSAISSSSKAAGAKITAAIGNVVGSALFLLQLL